MDTRVYGNCSQRRFVREQLMCKIETETNGYERLIIFVAVVQSSVLTLRRTKRALMFPEIPHNKASTSEIIVS